MSLLVRRVGAWASMLLLFLATAVSGCSEGGEPRRDSSAITASASDSGSEATSSTAGPKLDDAQIADAAAEAVSERMSLYEGIFAGALALIRVGEETRFVTTGYGNLASHAAMTPRGRFQVASVTKPMAATLAMQLVRSGRLQLSDVVDRWLPGLVPGGRQITIEHLLSHRSGLPEYAPYVDSHLHYEPEQLVGIALTHGKRSPVGTGGYANTNYILLGLIIEKVTGRPLGEELQRRVFDPAGMDDTSFAPRHGGTPEIRGYTGTTDVTSTDLSWLWATGGAVSTAYDLDAFLTALLHGEPVAWRAVADMTDPRGSLPHSGDSEYGSGLASPEAACGTAVRHAGRIRGYSTDM